MSSRLSMIKPADATGVTADLFGKIRAKVGKVPNLYATIGAHSPDALGAALSLDAAIGASTLDSVDVETIRLAVSEVAGCDYCLAAHTLVGKIAGLSADTMKQVRRGDATGDAKRDALVAFVRHIVTQPGTLPQAVLDAFLAAGYTERQVIETSLVIASITFTNIVNRVNDTTLDFPKAEAVEPAEAV